MEVGQSKETRLVEGEHQISDAQRAKSQNPKEIERRKKEIERLEIAEADRNAAQKSEDDMHHMRKSSFNLDGLSQYSNPLFIEAKAKLLAEKKAIQNVIDSGKKDDKAILDALDRRIYRDLINAYAIL